MINDDTWVQDVENRKRRWSAMGIQDDQTVLEVESNALSYKLALLQDQQSTLYPPPATKFTSAEDVVERLLPYHIWQIHDEELQGTLPPKRAQARDARDMKDAQDLVRRINTVKDRLVKVRQREGTHPSSLPSLINMINDSTHTVREELADVQHKLKFARQHYDAIMGQRRKDFAAQNPSLTSTGSNLPTQPSQQGSSSSAGLGGTAPMARPAGVRPPMSGGTPGPPTPTPNSASSTPGRPATIDGTPTTAPRPRGRPPKPRTQGGLLETVLSQSTTKNTPATPFNKISPINSPRPGTPSTPSPNPAGQPQMRPLNGTATPSGPSTPRTPGTPAGPGTPAAPGQPQGPVSITVPMAAITQFVNLGMIHVPPRPELPRPPATVVRSTEDKKGVVLSINLSLCTQIQLQCLAKILNVSASAKPAESAPAPST